MIGQLCVENNRTLFCLLYDEYEVSQCVYRTMSQVPLNCDPLPGFGAIGQRHNFGATDQSP